MSIRTILSLGAICLAISAAATAQDASGVFVDQKPPQFPKSELRDRREGWVVVNYVMADGGTIIDAQVADSSGSDAFEEAAVNAVRSWRVAEHVSPGEASVLINFVFETSRPILRRSFKRDYLKIEKLIGEGQLDKADALVNQVGGKDLYPTEVAYTWIARAHIAEVRGDKVEQLHCFRKAGISGGQWLDRREYLKLLRAMIVIAIQTGDYASSVRDFDILTQTGPGRKLGADLAEAVEQARLLADGQTPFMATNAQLDVTHETPRSGFRIGSSAPMSGGDDRGSVPPAREPSSPGNSNNSG